MAYDTNAIHDDPSLDSLCSWHKDRCRLVLDNSSFSKFGAT
jgi:hypothetical protein